MDEFEKAVRAIKFSYTNEDEAIKILNEHFHTFSHEFISYQMYCVAKKGCNRILKAFLNKGVDPNIVWNYHNTTPLAGAIESNKFETIKLLLEHGADPNKKISAYGENLLTVPIVRYDNYYKPRAQSEKNKFRKTVELLLKYGAKIPTPEDNLFEVLTDNVTSVIQEKEIEQLKEKIKELENTINTQKDVIEKL